LLKKDLNSLTDEEKEKRRELLIQKYVTEYQEKEEERKAELEGKAEGKGKGKGEKSDEDPSEFSTEEFLDAMEDTGDKKDEQSDAGEKGEEEKQAGSEDKGEEEEKQVGSQDKDEEEKPAAQEKKDDEKEDNGLGTEKGNRSLLSNTYGLIRTGAQARDRRKKGDKRGATLKRFDFASKFFSTAGTGLENGISGVKPDENASIGLELASNTMKMAGSGTDMAKGIYQSRSYGKLVNSKDARLAKSKLGYTSRKSQKKYRELREALKKGDTSKDKRMELLKARNDYRRSQDFTEAIAAAQTHAKIKSRAGKTGAVSAGLSLGGDILNTIGAGLKLAGPIGGLVGTILGGFGSLMKMGSKDVQKASEAMEKKAVKKANADQGKKYLEEKAAALLKKPEAKSDNMTEDEAKMIVAKRLGVDEPNDYEEIYKKLSERRAERILNKEEGYEDVLAAMDLPKDADKAMILEALGVS